MSKIKQLRKARGISQRQLAQDAGVCQSLLCAIENDRLRIWPAMAKRLAKALDIKASDLSITLKGGESKMD